MRLHPRIFVLLLVVAPLHAQPLKNVKILTGLSRPELQRVMNLMSDGLGVHCHYCHANDASEGASDAKPEKARAREMIRMVMDLNARHFGGREVVTCYTCHNGKEDPEVKAPHQERMQGPPPPPTGPRSNGDTTKQQP